ncbi:TRAP-type C4-dicarboxylate transport system substrate-binding protein [Bacillus oleivorans]|uniref:TRAP-type C4-dicarboxylate transport system substrate-binding protein n=1 Tax=Bacillus oleivorans TaxID=1448271 RepID=A0A285CNW3_9BACI|nr:TRAP transporter substrate-binding protein [Bacillus oleivorans]SNX68746.1 TRAP-type C4-dicarboxylate transport system substrate-binding protein [Bacillus oleivorans]
MQSKRNKLVFLIMSIFVISMATACGSESSGGSGESGEKIEFKMGHMNSTEHVQDSMAMRPFSEEVAEATDGCVSFQIYPGGALGSPPETYDNILTGIMDAGWGLQGYNAGLFPVHSVLHLPFLANGTGAELSTVAQKLYDTFPEIQEEYKDVKVLWFHAADPYAIITKDKPVSSFEDVKGLKLRAPSVEAGAMIESWGATPVSLPAPEIYDAISKGVIDGGVLPVAALADFNLFDVVDYVSLGNFNTSLFYVVMNKASWDKISPEDQAIIEEMIGEPMAKQAGEAFDTQKEEAEKKAKEMGIEFISLSEDELNKFKEASKGVTEQWLSDMEKKGIDGQKIYDETVKLIEGN